MQQHFKVVDVGLRCDCTVLGFALQMIWISIIARKKLEPEKVTTAWPRRSAAHDGPVKVNHDELCAPQLRFCGFL